MIADLMVTTGKFDEALAAYQKGLAIEAKLAADDPGNAQWQRDLFLTYERIATILEKEGKLDAALKAYRDSLAVAERLAAIDRNNTLWQHDLAISYARVGDMLMAQDNEMRRSRPTVTASLFFSAWLPPTAATTSGSAIWRSPTTGSAIC